MINLRVDFKPLLEEYRSEFMEKLISYGIAIQCDLVRGILIAYNIREELKNNFLSCINKYLEIEKFAILPVHTFEKEEITKLPLQQDRILPNIGDIILVRSNTDEESVETYIVVKSDSNNWLQCVQIIDPNVAKVPVGSIKLDILRDCNLQFVMWNTKVAILQRNIKYFLGDSVIGVVGTVSGRIISLILESFLSNESITQKEYYEMMEKSIDRKIEEMGDTEKIVSTNKKRRLLDYLTLALKEKLDMFAPSKDVTENIQHFLRLIGLEANDIIVSSFEFVTKYKATNMSYIIPKLAESFPKMSRKQLLNFLNSNFNRWLRTNYYEIYSLYRNRSIESLFAIYLKQIK